MRQNASDKGDTIRRLARTAAHIELAYRALWSSAENKDLPAVDPASKLFSSEKFQSDAADLLDLQGRRAFRMTSPVGTST